MCRGDRWIRQALSACMAGALLQSLPVSAQHSDPWDSIEARQAGLQKCADGVVSAVSSRWRSNGRGGHYLDMRELLIDDLGMGTTAADVVRVKRQQMQIGVAPAYVVLRKPEQGNELCDLSRAYVVFLGSGQAGSMRAFGPVGR